jgi:hypothetical protein
VPKKKTSADKNAARLGAAVNPMWLHTRPYAERSLLEEMGKLAEMSGRGAFAATDQSKKKKKGKITKKKRKKKAKPSTAREPVPLEGTLVGKSKPKARAKYDQKPSRGL